jgi:ATP-dependent helicase YprA (DUF1998 family)
MKRGLAIQYNPRQYIINDLDLYEHKAYARPVSVDYHTRPRDLTDVLVVNVIRTAGVRMHAGSHCACRLLVD